MNTSLFTSLFMIGFGGLLIGATAGKVAFTYYQHRLEALYLICGGMLIGVISFELIPESVRSYSFWALLAGASLSVLLFIWTEQVVHRKFQDKSYLPVFAFVLAVISHNIPVGIALGMTSVSNGIGMSLLLALFIHHLPEGVALYILTRMNGFHRLFVILAASSVTIILTLSAWFGVVSYQSNLLNGLFMGVAIGSLSYVAVHEMIGHVVGRVLNQELYLYTSLGILLLAIYLEVTHKLF
ncbi:ZIP family metal transporter [Alkalihalobacillus hwajinpoensis]|uniref:ZIP family metal transporter n=1 Tax=Guptibacillus hwajinpoensis TaxID=208199 RepID=UPI00188380E2|nr:ZIP family metal transporter [Pseudalkalibacillus hwajinpoensis]MBF0709517.1 ZIP family metal transporter [Pseudalkalibacillus hwajinpoensis]